MLVLLALSACGPALTGHSRGPTLATLGGQLSLGQGVALKGDVRLGIAWYPDISADDPQPPKAIVTEELRYSGTFPQAFTFRLTAPPPRDALAPVVEPGAPAAAAALGQLFAYEDLDGDGRLTLDASGRASDRILGSSAGAGAFDFYTAAERWLVLWAQDGATLELTGVRPGYNLLRYSQPLTPPEVLPLESPIPLALSAEPRLALLACPEAYVDPLQLEEACGVRVWSTPSVSATIAHNDDGSLDAFVLVGNGAGASSTVRINGELVPADSGAAHTLYEATPRVLRVGENVIEVEQAGFEKLTLKAVVPARFEVTAPAAGATVKAGSTLDASWTLAAGATLYTASLTVEGAPMASSSEFSAATSARLVVPAGAGMGDLSVAAYEHLPLARASALGLSVRHVALVVTP